MLSFEIKQRGSQRWLETALRGKPLLTTPQLNKGTAFTTRERQEFGLLGKLPNRVETLEEQVARAYAQFQDCESPNKKNIYLNSLHDINQILFYRLVSDHLEEMLPILYTPFVGAAVERFSLEFRRARGIYLAYPDIDAIDTILANRSNPEIDLIVVTDGEGILGIGDQGIGGIDIPVAKLMVYSLCGGIDPCRTLPICLDVGTNNQTLLEDPFYLGWRQPRISGKDYDVFVDKFIQAVKRHFPRVFLHWEDFGKASAARYLERYRHQLCSFNDDIQGTGAVTVAAVMAAMRAAELAPENAKIVIVGAGTAGMGITHELCRALERLGVTKEQARKAFWLIDRQGLLVSTDTSLTTAQQQFARDPRELCDFQNTRPPHLAELIPLVQPNILIGCSAQGGYFNQTIVESLCKTCAKPIIFPLSNPTDKAEATPQDLLTWTKGQALVATGSPFANVLINGESHLISQCNNALIFPGLGLGLMAIKAKVLSDDMLWAATQALYESAPILHKQSLALLPKISQAQDVAKEIATRVACVALQQDLHSVTHHPISGEALTQENIRSYIESQFWYPEYLPMYLTKGVGRT